MTGFEPALLSEEACFHYITSTLIGRGCLTTIIYDSAEGTLLLIQLSLLYPMGMPRIELGSHAYKAWALTNMRHSRKMNLLSFVIILSVYSEKFIIGRNHHCCLTIVSHYTYCLPIFNSFKQFIKVFIPLFHSKDFHSWFIYEETARSAYSI